MLFWMLFVFAPLGVAATLGLTWLVGGFKDARLEAADAARRWLRELDPAFEVQDVVLAVDGRGAIFTGEIDGREPGVALLVPLGDRFFSRVLGSGDVVAASLDEGGALRIDTHDLTRRTLRLRLEEGAAPAWLALLRELTPEGAGR
ncbi:MAG: hypothetical protein R3B09_17830 [Nannocystaceae bacterium]